MIDNNTKIEIRLRRVYGKKLFVVLWLSVLWHGINLASTLTVKPTDIAPPVKFQGNEVAFLKLELWVDVDSVTWSSLTVLSTGTAQDSDAEVIKVYRDNNTNGTFDGLGGGDAPVSFSDASGPKFINGMASIAMQSPQLIETSTITYFVVAKIASGATAWKTLGVKISSAGAVGLTTIPSDVNSDTFPMTSSLTTIEDSASILSVTYQNLAAASTIRGSNDVPFLRFNVQVDLGTAQINKVIVNRLGNSGDGAVNSLKLYRDDGDGIFESTAVLSGVTKDTLVSSGSDIFSGNVSTITLVPPQIITLTPSFFYIAAGIPYDAPLLSNFGVSLASAASIILSGAMDTVSGVFPMNSGFSDITDPANTVFVTFITTAPAVAYQNQAVAMGLVALQTNSGTSGWSGLRVDLGNGEIQSNVSRVYLYKDVNDDNVLGPGDLPIADGAFGNSGLSGVTQLNFPMEAVATAPKKYFLVYELSPYAVKDDTVTVVINNAGYYTLNYPNSGISGAFIQKSATTRILETVDTVFVTSSYLAPVSVSQGAGNVVLLKLNFRTGSNSASLTQLRVGHTGGSDADISNVRVYKDNAPAGVFGSEDLLVTSGTDRFSLTNANLPFNSVQSINTSGLDYLLVVDFSANASFGVTHTFSLSGANNLTIINPDVADTGGFPVDVATTIAEFPDLVTVVPQNLAPAAVSPATFNVPLMRLALFTDNSSANWKRIRIDRTGSGLDMFFSKIKIFSDDNGSGSFEAGTDVKIGEGMFSGATLTLDFPVWQLISATTNFYFIVGDVSIAASPNETLGVRLMDVSYITVDNPNTVKDINFPMAATDLIINEPVSVVTASAQNMALSAVLQGAVDVPLLKLTLRTGSYTAKLNAIRIARAGTGGLDQDVKALKLYYDTDNSQTLNKDQDKLLTSGSDKFKGGLATLALTNPDTITTVTKTYFVVADVSPVAKADAGLGVSLTDVTAITVAGPDQVNSSGFPMAGAVSKIKPTTDTLNMLPQQVSLITVLQGDKNVVMGKIGLSANANQIQWTSLILDKLGALPDSDVTGVKIYRDANANGLLDTASDLLLTGGQDKFSQGKVSLVLGSPETLDTDQQLYFIAMDFAGAGAIGQTIGFKAVGQTAFVLVAPDIVPANFVSWESQQPSVADKPDEVTMMPVDSAGSGIYQGKTKAMAKLRLASGEDYARLLSLNVLKTGNVPDNAINSAALYLDSDGNGIWDGTADKLLTSGLDRFDAGMANLTLQQPLTINTTYSFVFLTLTMKDDTPVGQNAGLTISSSGDLILEPQDTVSGLNLPFSTSLAVVKDSRVPTTPVVTTQNNFTANVTKLDFTWQTEVYSGQLAMLEYAVGTMPGQRDVVEWAPVSSLTQVNSAVNNLKLQNGQTYFISVRAKSNYGYYSDVGMSQGITVDTTEPRIDAAPAVKAEDNKILLSWQKASTGVSGVSGYVVEERTGGKPAWQAIANGYQSPGLAPGLVTSNQILLSDKQPDTYFYRVKPVNGAMVTGEPSPGVKIVIGDLGPDIISQVSNYPNPFDSRREDTVINYTLNNDSHVKIIIYDEFGGSVRTMSFDSGAQGGLRGSNDVIWDGTDSSGRKLSQGTYLAILGAAGQKKTLRIGVQH